MGLGEKEKQSQKKDVAQGQDTASTGGHRVCSHPLGFVFLGDRTEDGAPDLPLQEEGAIFREETPISRGRVFTEDRAHEPEERGVSGSIFRPLL